MSAVALDGEGWQLRGCLGREWEWHVGRTKAGDDGGWIRARVPGSVLDDLWRAGEVPNPYYERNSLLVEGRADLRPLSGAGCTSASRRRRPASVRTATS